MKAIEVIQRLGKDFEQWTKYSKPDGFYYQKNLTEKQTKWFLDLFNQEQGNLIYETSASGIVEIDGRPIYYHIVRIRSGVGILRFETLNFIAYYMQYMDLHQEPFETYDFAYNRLYALFDDGDAVPVGIYDGRDRVLYASDELNYYDETVEKIRRELGVAYDRVEKIKFD